MAKMRNANKLLVRKPAWKGPLRRQRGTWKDNIQMYLTETGLDVIQDRNL
jgi:hypothetical protein